MLAKLNRTTGGIFLTASLGALSIGATANAQILNPNDVTVIQDDCPGCDVPQIQTIEDMNAYLIGLSRLTADGDGDDGGYYGDWEREDDDDDDDDDERPQVVFVDFDAGGLPTFPVCRSNGTLFGVFLDHVYTDDERAAILARIRADYSEYNYKFVDKEPTKGPYSTLRIGENDAPFDCSEGSNITVTPTGGVSILFGRAEKIDFLNRDKSDGAFADASFWEFLAQLDPSGFLFELFSGIPLDAFGGDLNAAVSAAVVNQTSNTGAHEVGHIQGLRHQDSLGAPGQGLPPVDPDFGPPILPIEFFPEYVNDPLFGAFETYDHTMASGASVGLPLEGSTITDRFFSERSSVRIAHAEEGKIRTEAKIRKNGRNKVSLAELDVANTILLGENAGKDLEVKSLVIEGSIDELGEVDTYMFRGKAGDFANLKIINLSSLQLSFEEGIEGRIRLFHVAKDGTETLVADNAQSFESFFDAEIFDAVLPYNGWYKAEVTAPGIFYINGFGIPADFFTCFIDEDGNRISCGDIFETGDYSLHIYTLRAENDDDDDEDEDDDD